MTRAVEWCQTVSQQQHVFCFIRAFVTHTLAHTLPAPNVSPFSSSNYKMNRNVYLIFCRLFSRFFFVVDLYLTICTMKIYCITFYRRRNENKEGARGASTFGRLRTTLTVTSKWQFMIIFFVHFILDLKSINPIHSISPSRPEYMCAWLGPSVQYARYTILHSHALKCTHRRYPDAVLHSVVVEIRRWKKSKKTPSAPALRYYLYLLSIRTILYEGTLNLSQSMRMHSIVLWWHFIHVHTVYQTTHTQVIEHERALATRSSA